MKHPWIEQIEVILRERWWQGLMGILGLILVMQLYSWASTLLDFNRINNLIAQAEELNIQPEEDSQSQQPPNQPSQPAKNIFKKEQVQYQLTGILMDYAIINGKNVKVGGKTGKAEVTEIGNDYVVIQEEGKDQTQTLTLFKGGSSEGNRGNTSPRPNRNRPNRRDQEKKTTINKPSLPSVGSGPKQMEVMKMPPDAMGIRTTIEVQNISPEQMQTLQSSRVIQAERR